VNRFLTWLREWRGLQARLWVAHEDIISLRGRVLALEGDVLHLRSENTKLKQIKMDAEEASTYMYRLLKDTLDIVNPVKPLQASDLHTLRGNILQEFQRQRLNRQ